LMRITQKKTWETPRFENHTFHKAESVGPPAFMSVENNHMIHSFFFRQQITWFHLFLITYINWILHNLIIPILILWWVFQMFVAD
jgi:hypothetical protein